MFQIPTHAAMDTLRLHVEAQPAPISRRDGRPPIPIRLNFLRPLSSMRNGSVFSIPRKLLKRITLTKSPSKKQVMVLNLEMGSGVNGKSIKRNLLLIRLASFLSPSRSCPCFYTSVGAS